MKYNTAGAVVSRTSPWDGTNTRTVKIGYEDNWNADAPSATFAYPTKVYDPDGNYSTVMYRYDIGANVEANSPAPAGQTYGKTTKRIYDSIGRMERDSVYINTTEHAYTRYEYPTNGIQSKVYSTLIDTDNDGADADDEVLSETWTDGAGRVRLSRVPHTFNGGSTSTWAGSITEYNILGRVKRQSVPTEVNSSFEPAGDDYTRGFLWTYQKYDWMGRVVRKINTDGIDQATLNDSDVLISYEGCGCAGGLITTIEGENIVETDWDGSNPVALGRRKQKIYQDIEGRAWKDEVMMWDGTTVYGTTVHTYNGRDQITNTRQYWGSTSSQSYRNVAMTYDGHARMKTRHYPIEDANTNTSWTYNADSSINTVTDPRGVVTNFSYYQTTGLLHQITYDVPQGQTANIPDTPDVTFTYDDLGNRTAMTDGTGTSSYTYNSLSQIVSETKAFTGLTESFTINYTYDLSGALKTMSNPHDSARKVIYGHDRAGRVTGADIAVQGIMEQYVHGTKYRAWGDLKEFKYLPFTEAIFSHTLEFYYDSRLQLSSYSDSTPFGTLFSLSFERYADGKLKKATTSAPWLDRLYKYDHVGRLVKGYSGKDANGDPNVVDGPYKQDISYNGFSEVTQIAGKYWGLSVPSYSKSYSVSTGRSGSTGYDAAGNVVTDRGTMKYDAAGRQVETFDPAVHTCCEVDHTYNSYYDGNGWQVKREDHAAGPNPVVYEVYEVRSTVLEGEKVGELRHPDAQYPQRRFIVPVLGGKLTYTNIVGYSESTIFSREIPEAFARDPRGAEIGDDPGSSYTGGGSSYPSAADPYSYGRCAWEGLPMSCEMASKLTLASERIDALTRRDAERATTASRPSSRLHESLHGPGGARAATETNKPEADPERSGTVDPASVPNDSGDDDTIYGYANDSIGSFVTVRAGLFPDVDASVSGEISWQIQKKEQLPKCLRDFLRPFFPSIQVGNGRTLSPVDDARFVSGLPKYINGKTTSAVTLGLYDIHYDSGQVDLTGGQDKSSIGVIAEEIAHSAQFIKVWEEIEQKMGADRSYPVAQIEWQSRYLAASGKIVAKNIAKTAISAAIGIPLPHEDSYRDNSYEKEAQAIRATVWNAAQALSKSPCYP